MPEKYVATESTEVSFWQARTSNSLSNEDERKIKDNLVGFFSLLNEWSIKENDE